MSADNWRDCPKCGKERAAREGYEIYSEGDTVYVSYRIHCDSCSFSDEKNIEGFFFK